MGSHHPRLGTLILLVRERESLFGITKWGSKSVALTHDFVVINAPPNLLCCRYGDVTICRADCEGKERTGRGEYC